MITKKLRLSLIIFIQLFVLISIVNALIDSNPNNNIMNVSINVVETRQLKIDFVSIDNRSTNFNNNVVNSTQFLNVTYPIADLGIVTNIRSDTFLSDIGHILDEEEEADLIRRLFKEGRISKKTDRVVGIVPEGWFASHGQILTKGYTYISYKSNALKRANIKAIIVEEGFRQGSAHELAHTFGLCDEYSNSDWQRQDTANGTSINLCPNGDIDNDNSLDASCLDGSIGCDTITLGKLVPWNLSNNTIPLFNFMGVSDDQNKRWVDNLTYAHLLKQLSEPPSILQVIKAILFSGKIYKNGTVILDNSYILDEQAIDNETSSGNFSINLVSNGSLFFNMTFDAQFLITKIGGNTTETNVTPFAFVVPYSDNVTKILVKENETVIRSEKNITPNTPTINITTQLSNQIFDELITVNWNASDLDNDTIQYAVLISSDNGNTYSTLQIDYPNTSLTINSTNFINSNQYKIKILATDGINTGNDTSDTFSIYHDNNQNKFTIKNSSGSNIAWFGDQGNIVIKGVLEQNSNFVATNNFAFKVRNNANDVLIIENNGSMYIDGTLTENYQSEITSPETANDLGIYGSDGKLVGLINTTGYLTLKGSLTQN